MHSRIAMAVTAVMRTQWSLFSINELWAWQDSSFSALIAIMPNASQPGSKVAAASTWMDNFHS
jgi:hypothetical protein